MEEHILIAASHKWPMYAPAFAQALEQNGARVSRFDFDRFTNNSLGRLETRIGLGFTSVLLNWSLRSMVKTRRPDICLIWTGLTVWPSTIDYIKQFCWVTSYTNDDPFGPRGQAWFWRLFKQTLPHYHSHHVYRDLNIADYKACGADCVGILRSYYIPEIHYFEDNDTQTHSKYPIVFIGHGEPNRIEVISVLANAGLPVAIFGPKSTWQNINKLCNGIRFYHGGLDPTAYRQVISNSAICLGFLSRVNRDNYTRRYFEIPACRGFLLAERTDFALSLFTEGKEVEYFTESIEAVEKCRTYLNNITLRHTIAESGRQRCYSSGYSVRSRAAGWLQDIRAFRD